MIPARRIAGDLEIGHRRAARRQRRQRIRLGIEGIHALGLAGPVPAGTRRLGGGAAQAGGTLALILRPVAGEDLPHFEQSRIAEAAIRIGLGGPDQPRQQRGAHVGEIGSDGIDQRQFRRAAAEQFGLRLGDERPGDRLHQTARRQRPAGLAGARICNGVSTGRRAPSRGNSVSGTRSRPRMRTTSSTRSALPSMSPRHDGGTTSSTGPLPERRSPGW